MPTPTYVPLATITLTATDTEIVFSSIPATFRDLVLVVAGTSTAAATFGVRFNSDTGSNYSHVEMTGPGSGSGTSSAGTLTFALMGRLGSTQSANVLQVMDYSATDKHTTALARGGQASELVRASVSRHANTNAVNSISVVNATFAIGTTFSLYGVN